MKNKKIICSLDNVLPHDTTKNKILNNIISGKKKGFSLNKKTLAPILCCLFVMIIFLANINNLDNEVPTIIDSRGVNDKITYNGKCYEEVGIYKEDVDELEFIEKTEEFIMGEEIYQKGNSIVFKNTYNYIEFQECKGE